MRYSFEHLLFPLADRLQVVTSVYDVFVDVEFGSSGSSKMPRVPSDVDT